MNIERSRRASAEVEDLPPLEDIVFRVQLDVLKDDYINKERSFNKKIFENFEKKKKIIKEKN